MKTKEYQLNLDFFDNKQEDTQKTIFSLANGHFGVEAINPINESINYGTNVNGYFDTGEITYGEKAFGYASEHQTIVNIPSLRTIYIQSLNGTTFDKSMLKERTLDMKTGILTEKFVLENSSGETIQMEVTSFVGQSLKNWYGIEYSFAAGTYVDDIYITKNIIFNRDIKQVETDDPRKQSLVQKVTVIGEQEQDSYSCVIKTQNTNLSLPILLKSADEINLSNYKVSLKKMSKVGYIFGIGDIQENVKNPFLQIPNLDEIKADSISFWKNTWENSALSIDDSPKLNKASLYNMFQLFQSAGRDGKTSLSAKGLSGTGYEGHYFWDTEMYGIPYFAHTSPGIARNLLIYRFNCLDQSRKRASELGVDKGALFAWRTINGLEASAYYPAGTAQYHIDADIAFAVDYYYKATKDNEFIEKYGMELILETARFWKGFGDYNTVDGQRQFEFHTVTGPDEYTALVDNNYYTNRMAKYNLSLVKKYADILKKNNSNKTKELKLTDEEIIDLDQTVKDVYLPYNTDKGIYAQDDSFLQKPVWPFDKTPKENYPLLLHYHPLTIYRYQVAKQADTLLAEYLFAGETPVDQLEREYDYYDKVTTHDSSLSKSIYGIIAARLNRTDETYNAFKDSVLMDLENSHGNTDDGLHVANLAGSWLSIVAGFAGMSLCDDYLSFEYHLPKQFSKLKFRMLYLNNLLEISLSQNSISISLIKGTGFKTKISDTIYELNSENKKITQVVTK